MEPTFRASVAAAFLAGLPVLLAFFVWHWFAIAPVWTVLAEGLVGVAVAALGVAWGWRRSRRAGRFAGRWGAQRASGRVGVLGEACGGLAFGAVFAGALVLAEAIGLARGPTPDPASVAEALPIVPFALAPAVAVAAAGWRLAGGWRGALAYGLAALVLLFYLGGSIVQRGGVGLGLGLFLLLVPSYLAAGAILPPLESALATRAAR